MNPELKEITEALQKRDIADLQKSITSGFDGVHARQDITNGRIGKVEGRVDTLEKDNIRRDGRRYYEKLIWWILTSSFVIITTLISYIIYHIK